MNRVDNYDTTINDLIENLLQVTALEDVIPRDATFSMTAMPTPSVCPTPGIPATSSVAAITVLMGMEKSACKEVL